MNTDKIPQLHPIASTEWHDYALIDSGGGETLERFSSVILIRPEPQAIWSRSAPDKLWESADAVMIPTGGESGGYWKYQHPIKQPWTVDYKGLKSELRLSKSRHIGLFPEQAAHWDWIERQIRTAKRPMRVINLFGYTGMSTAAAARAGAQVTHVDASKHAVAWASHNLDLSGLGNAPVRWLVEDARKYLTREAKRKSYYDGIILDPPKFGRGPGGKVWEYFKDIIEMLKQCRAVLSSQPKFICMTSYAIQASAFVPHQALSDVLTGLGGTLEGGELVSIEQSQGRILSHALYTRWSAD